MSPDNLPEYMNGPEAEAFVAMLAAAHRIAADTDARIAGDGGEYAEPSAVSATCLVGLGAIFCESVLAEHSGNRRPYYGRRWENAILTEWRRILHRHALTTAQRIGVAQAVQAELCEHV